MKWTLLALAVALPLALSILGGMTAPYVIAMTLAGLVAFFAGVASMADEP